MTSDDQGPSERPTAPTDGGAGDEHGTGHLIGGRYALRRSLGRGGMGVVWAARDVTLDRDVAIKEVTLPPGLDEQQRTQLRERTLREARAAARIRSEAAVTVYDVVEEDGRPWIVMELLPPRSLADVVREEGPLTPDAAARTGLRLLDALAAAHAAGVLHRDVKPANVLFDAAGRAVLTDFGIASLEGDPSMTTTGTVVGSPGYVAPERALGRPPSPATDLWSLGVTLAAAVHGRSPFEKGTPLATIVAAMQDPLPEAVVTGPLGPVIDRLLSKDPARRPDVTETRRLLEAAASGAVPAGAPATGAAGTAVMPAVGLDTSGRSSAQSAADAQLTQALPRVPASPAARGARPAATSSPFTSGAGAAAAAGAVVAGAAAGHPGTPRPGTPRPPAVGAAGAGTTRPPGQPRPRPGVAAPDRADRSPSRLLPVLLALVAVVVAGMVAVVALERRDDPATASPATTTTTAPGDPGTAPAGDPAPGGAAGAPLPGGGASGSVSEDTVGEDTAAAPEEPSPAQDPGDTAGDGIEAGQAPEGFQLYEDAGYRVAVPEGWTIEARSDSRTVFQDPASRRYLLVEEGGEPAGDPVEDWERQEAAVSGSGRFAGYELLGIERAEYRGFDAADWQFRWDAEGGPLRVLNRAVVDTELNRAYALYWSVPAEEWDAAAPVFDSIAASFQPLG